MLLSPKARQGKSRQRLRLSASIKSIVTTYITVNIIVVGCGHKPCSTQTDVSLKALSASVESDKPLLHSFL